MLHRILSHSADIAKRTQAQHCLLLFSPRTSFLPQTTSQSISTFRNFSTNKYGGNNKIGSCSQQPGKKVIGKDTKVDDKSSIATSDSTRTSSIETAKQILQQSEPQKAATISSETLSPETISKTSTPRESKAPKDSSTDALSAPFSRETSIQSSVQSFVAEGSALATYYDKAFQLWTERSGTKEILSLKESVNEAGVAFDSASAAVTTNRRNLDEALRKWERASGQHMQLLQRRESWTPEDAQRFADFVSLEITSRAELEQARHDLGRSEEILTKAQLDYINKMRRRYHEEQIWQDQWRVLGTYGTWTLIVLNSCVFLGSQYFQRRRERDRMEAIERLITENRVEGIHSEIQNISEDSKTSEKPATKIPAAIEDNTDKNVPSTTESIDKHGTETNENDASTTIIEEESTINSQEQLQAETLPVSEHEDSPKTTMSEKSKHSALERIEAAAASVGSFLKHSEQQLRLKTKEVARTMNQKVRQALPAEIANEIPKTVSEIHVPSAVIGASVAGIAAVTMSVILSAFSNRRN